MLRATTVCTFSKSQLPNVVRAWYVLYILTSKCASRHNSVHFFDISTSKRCLSMVCFVHFDFEMCFAPQRRALFRHLNLQKWFEPDVCFVHFDFEMCFAPQQRALFRRRNFQKFLCSVHSSRHNGMHFFDISTSKSGSSMVCFVRFDFEMWFAPQRRALFRHLNCQKWSAPLVFCTF